MAPEEQKQTTSKPVENKAPEQKYKHIVRIANVDIPGEKQVRFALRNIKGVGINFADALCATAKVEKTKKTGTLSDNEILNLNKVMENPAAAGIPFWMFNRKKDKETGIDKHIITGTLGFVQENDIKMMKMIKCYKGMRHAKGKPVRGQRTRSNFRKSKGKVVGVAKKKTIAAAAAKKDKK